MVSNDEMRAEIAWQLLTVQNVQNAYILSGGINLWLHIYGKDTEKLNSDSIADGDDTLKYRFEAALGSRHPASDPDPQYFPEREFEKKVKSLGGVKKQSGGCG